MREFLRLIKRLGIMRKYIFLLILRSPFDALRAWMLAGLMKTTFLCLETGDSDRLLADCIVYGLICIALFFYNGTIWSIYAAFSAKIEVLLQKMMLNKILAMSLKRVGSRFSGEWITRLNSDIHAALTMMNGAMNIPHAVVAIINTMLSCVLMLRSSLFLFMATWLFILPHMFLNYRIVLRHIPKLKEASMEAMADSTSSIKPLITEADTILLYDAGEMMLQKCEENSVRLIKINLHIHMRNALSNVVMRVFGISSYLAILLIGYSFIYQEIMSFSDVVYCFQIRGSILGGLFMLFTCMSNIKANSVCIKRIQNTLDE